VTALGRLIRTTAFKIIAVYLIIFALFSAAVIAYLARHTQNLVVSQITETIEAEMQSLQDHFLVGGINRLVDVVEARARQPGSNLYLVTTYAGTAIVGNVQIATGTLDRPGWSEISYRRAEEPDVTHESRALVRVAVLPGGFRLLVGRDFEERDRLRQILAAPARWALLVIVVMGIAGALFIARRVLKRIDGMTATSDSIMAGDLSGRLAVAGSGDEFDRLANSLNAMLDRIEGLMAGVKHVSDNIAHDLKTPLTRLRNQAEEALRSSRSEGEYRAALEATLEESDSLIRTFDALLMIARAEVGEVRSHMVDFDVAEAARSVAELYEPLAEDKELTLRVDARGPLVVHGNRELIGQALANLVDNAIKHGDTVACSAGEVHVSAREDKGRALITVSDRGPGIAAKDRERVLERFVRLEASRSRPGAGLGLSLAAAVARLHGGELLLEDNAPGLRATLAIPAQAR
jgi:signal transduction histidine kinase